MNLVILGKPGAGKGTICTALVEKENFLHISTGDIFRKEISAKTELGLLADSYISKGHLVPDEVTNIIVEKVLEDNKSRNLLLDGYPRTVNQAIDLEKSCKKLNIKLDAALCLDVSDELIIDRLTSRIVCKNCGASFNLKTKKPLVENVCDCCKAKLVTRSDDNIESIKERLAVYEVQTKPVVDYYKDNGLLINVDGEQNTIDELVQVVISKLNERKSLSSQNL